MLNDYRLLYKIVIVQNEWNTACPNPQNSFSNE